MFYHIPGLRTSGEVEEEFLDTPSFGLIIGLPAAALVLLIAIIVFVLQRRRKSTPPPVQPTQKPPRSQRTPPPGLGGTQPAYSPGVMVPTHLPEKQYDHHYAPLQPQKYQQQHYPPANGMGRDPRMIKTYHSDMNSDISSYPCAVPKSTTSPVPPAAPSSTPVQHTHLHYYPRT